MARVTVEDCVEKVANRFDLVLLAAQRARDISSGSQLTVERDNDRNPVIALREIAEETVELEALQDGLIKGYQRQVEFDEPEEDRPEIDLPEAAGELVAEASAVAQNPEAAGEAPPEPAESVEAPAAPEQLVAGAVEEEIEQKEEKD